MITNMILPTDAFWVVLRVLCCWVALLLRSVLVQPNRWVAVLVQLVPDLLLVPWLVLVVYYRVP